ncbi:MAG TPA: hypothetical protein VFX03_17085 [Thermomicrobiales bacterium]|nr:hypothetical protein [Thermomicrobiales bacterium]
MEDDRFDDLTRAAAGGASRRRVLAGAVALAAPAIGLVFEWDDEQALAGKLCKPPGAPCGRDRQCCAHKCKNRVCGCKGAGANCFRLGIVCCSKRCHRGKCRGG